jgi:uracil-DNA glycosylase family 4
MAATAKFKLDPLTSEPLSNALPSRLACAACDLFRACKSPFMRPYVPKGWTGKLLLVGEAPGEDEDENSGRPFTGAAGKLLRRLYIAAGYSDLDTAFVNAVRCRPHHNATPTLRQVRACRNFVLRVIEQIRPEFVLALGNIALRSVTNSGKLNVTKSRGRELAVPGLLGTGECDRGTDGPHAPYMPRVFATYHPAAVLHGATHLAARIQADLEQLRKPVEEWPSEAIPNAKLIAVDTEYHGLDVLTVGVSDASHAAATDASTAWRDSGAIRGALEAASALAGHSLAGDVVQLVGANYPVREEWAQGRACFDSLLLSRMVDENDLKYELETKLLGVARVPPWKHRTTKFSETDARLWPPALRMERCRLDAWAARRIAAYYNVQLARQKPLVEYTHRIASTLERVTLAGAMIDLARFEPVELRYRQDMERTRQDLVTAATLAGVLGFRPSNDGDIRSLLYDKLKLPVLRRTEKGKAGVDLISLKNLGNPAADKLVEYAKAEKLWSVNAAGLAKLYHPCGSVGDTPAAWLPFHINPLGARTGRRASNHPNSQNWPRAVRGLVFSRWPGGLIGDHDYQKLEVILIAWVSGDELLLHDFTVGRGYFDVAKGLLGVDVEKDTPLYRGVKSIALGVHYNMQTRKMARQLWSGIINDDGTLSVIRFSADYQTHETEVDRLRRKYLGRYLHLQAYMRRQEAQLLRHQAVVSYTGRVRHLPLVDGRDTPGYGHLLNQAINFPIQSLASDVTGSALVDIESELLALHGLTYVDYTRLLLEAQRKVLTNPADSAILYPINMSLIFNEVHDDVVVDFHPDHFKRDQELVVESMRAVRSLRQLAPGFDLKLGVDVKAAPHWGDK